MKKPNKKKTGGTELPGILNFQRSFKIAEYISSISYKFNSLAIKLHQTS